LKKKSIQLDGPMSYCNWLAYNKNQMASSISEYPLFTDAYITGEVSEGLGPYQLLNTLAGSASGRSLPGIVLRAAYCLDRWYPDFSKTDTRNYHGGWYTDEIAALVSLSLGIRVKAGDVSRHFDNMTDPLGRPKASRSGSEPVLICDHSNLIIPSAAQPHCLNDVSPLLQVIPSLSKKQAIGLIRAARLYRDALWIAESEPALAWVMFVSALEVGAGLWHKGGVPAVSKLKAMKPNLFKILEDTGIENLPERVAEEIADTLGSQKKFINFVVRFIPEPPERRPLFASIHWELEQMQAYMKTIYDYRSRALHRGEPFPAPMCQVETLIEGVLPERPTGLATYSHNSVWLKDDTPMFLHIFEYITRGVLLNWLKSLQPTTGAS
jgi:hypothetical protein